MKRLIVTLLLCAFAFAAHAAPDAAKPKVRAITAFVRIDRSSYEAQIDEAMKVLNAAKAEFAKPRLRDANRPHRDAAVRGAGEGPARQGCARIPPLARRSLAKRRASLPNVGPAMLHDTDDPAAMRLLAQVLSTLPHLNASAIIADDDGIHWKTIRESAKLVRYVTDHTARSQGNFQFTATAMLKPLGPFYPGAYHTGAGKQFSLGFEGANIVQEVFGATHGDFDASVAELTRQLTIHAQVGEEVGNTDRCLQRMDLRRRGSDAGAAGRCVDRRCDRALHGLEVRRERHDDGGARDHVGRESRESEADRLFRIDAAGDGRQASRAALGREHATRSIRCSRIPRCAARASTPCRFPATSAKSVW